MRKEVSDDMADVVSVETWNGESAYGPTYAAAANKTCNVISKRQLVIDADGEEVISELTLQAASTDEASFVPGSRVTISSRVSTVLSVNPRTFAGQVVYVEVVCS